MTSWTEFPWDDRATGPLCVGAGDPIRPDCRIEGADFTGSDPSVPSSRSVVVCAYNVERGLRLDDQLTAFTSDPGMPRPDVLLLSEADRGCTRTGGRNVAREYARALRMRYVYGVEFVELPRFWGPGGGRIREPCEHGNAILSRHPLGNVRLIRHRRTRNWHSRWQRTLRIGQPRRGGRVAVAADIRVGTLPLRLYAVHFESGRRRDDRRAQAAELIDDATAAADGVVIGGDMNVLGYRGRVDERAEPTVSALLDAGYVDPHAFLPPTDRITTDDGKTIDLIVGRDVRFVDAGVGPRPIWAGLSDHLPVWARLDLGAGDG